MMKYIKKLNPLKIIKKYRQKSIKKQYKKPQKLYIQSIGRRKKTVTILWILLISSLLFGIYKNFTAVNTHTIYEKKILKQEVIDTSKIENFVKNFAKVYHSWENNRKSLEQRTKQISYYTTKQLQYLNLDTVRVDIPTISKVNDIQIWEIQIENMQENNEELKINTDMNNLNKVNKKILDINNTVQKNYYINIYKVIYYVDQTIIEEKNNKKAYKNILSSFTTTVYEDINGNMIITQNPTICAKPTKSEYELQDIQTDNIDYDTQEEIEGFLKTFFKIYPKATEKELSYYVKNQIFKPINKNYIFVELINPIYKKQKDKGKIKIYTSVKYIDEDTKMILICQYELVLIKDNNWIIL